MKLIPIILFSILLSCEENLETDLPVTHHNSYIIGTTATFPQNTSASDVYNVIRSLYPQEGVYHSVTNGEWSYLRDLTMHEALSGTKLEKKPVAQIKHLHITYEPEINEHIIFLDCLATSYITNPTDSTSPETINIPAQEITIVFKWQRQTTNIWQNDTIAGLKFDF